MLPKMSAGGNLEACAEDDADAVGFVKLHDDCLPFWFRHGTALCVS